MSEKSPENPPKKSFLKALPRFIFNAFILLSLLSMIAMSVLGGLYFLETSFPDEKSMEILESGTPAQADIIAINSDSPGYSLVYSFTDAQGKTVEKTEKISRKSYDAYIKNLSEGITTVDIHYNDDGEVAFDDYPQTVAEFRPAAYIFFGIALIPILATVLYLFSPKSKRIPKNA